MADKEVKRLIPCKSREVHTVLHTVSLLSHSNAKRQIHVANYGQLWLCHNIDSLVAKLGAMSCWHAQGMLFYDCHDLSDLFHPAQKPEVTYRL